MKSRLIARLSVAAAMLSMPALTSPLRAADGPIRIASQRSANYIESAEVSDLRLGAEGALSGQVVDSVHSPRAGAAVTIAAAGLGGEIVARTITDEKGNFQARVARGGVYIVSAEGDERVVRTWTALSAPPAARGGVLLVADEAAVRGQAGSWVARNIIPIGLVGGMAGAIIAVTADGNDHPSGS